MYASEILFDMVGRIPIVTYLAEAERKFFCDGR
jgi:hypothetical protein